MFDRKLILTGVFAALFVAAFALPAFAFSASATPFAYSGKVVAIDNADKLLTVQAGPNDQQIFRMNDQATVSKCGQPESFSNLKIGDEVTIAYYQSGSNNNVADDIALAPSPGMMPEHCS